MVKFDILLANLPSFNTFYIHCSPPNPEDTGLHQIMEFAEDQQIITSAIGFRLFGRNTYPTSKPRPHGYEFYLTYPDTFSLQPSSKVASLEKKTLISGSYALLRSIPFKSITKGWKVLWDWVKIKNYTRIERQEAHGWVLGLEEIINWAPPISYDKWIFNLWAPIQPKL